MGTEQPKRPTESKPGKVFQTGSSPTLSTRIDLSYSYQALGGVGSTSQCSRVQDGGKSRHAERRANNVFSAGSSAYEEANIQADKAISGKDVPKEWHDRTNRAVFAWQEPRWKGGTVSYEDQKSTWNSGVRKAIR